MTIVVLSKVMKKSEKQEQNQGEVEDEGADRKYQVFRRNTFDRHLIEVNMIWRVSKLNFLIFSIHGGRGPSADQTTYF